MAPVAGIGIVPFVMVVSPLVPAKTIPEFIHYAKANPSKVKLPRSSKLSTRRLTPLSLIRR
jgi:tripartite-type tricarboxylate transporter receptor subunit TctC